MPIIRTARERGPSTYNRFMYEQTHLWLEQKAINPEVDVPISILEFYFMYRAKELFKDE